MVIISLMILIIAIAVTPNLSTPAHLPYGGYVEPDSLSESFILSNGGISSIQISKLTSIIFLFSGALSFNALYIQSIGSGLSLYSGLFNLTVLSQSFDIILFVLGSLILILWLNNNYLILNKFNCLHYFNKNVNNTSINKLRGNKSNSLKMFRGNKPFKWYNIILIIILIIALLYLVYKLYIMYLDGTLLIYIIGYVVSFLYTLLILSYIIDGYSKNKYIKLTQQIAMLLLLIIMIIAFMLSLSGYVYCEPIDLERLYSSNGKDTGGSTNFPSSSILELGDGEYSPLYMVLLSVLGISSLIWLSVILLLYILLIKFVLRKNMDVLSKWVNRIKNEKCREFILKRIINSKEYSSMSDVLFIIFLFIIISLFTIFNIFIILTVLMNLDNFSLVHVVNYSEYDLSTFIKNISLE